MSEAADDLQEPAQTERCWCVGRVFPETLTTLAKERDGGAACICRACLARHDETSA
ncbi:MAG: cysteine-rich CWC family protein [bacterium]|nr:cysteine-rich CWC family protein [bacterium]